MEWTDIPVLVTGGASFISSHLVDELVRLGAKVTVVDNLSSGKLENLADSIKKVSFVKMDVEHCDADKMTGLFKEIDVVFHLAAVHGGRGYIDTHPADACSNFAINQRVFESACKFGVKKVVFASSACVYPPWLQNRYDSDYLLKESDCDPLNQSQPLKADTEYGWTKLMGEIQLNAFIKQYGLKGCSVRFITVYGPRENETHAVIALIYKAFERMNPFVIWGTGEQDRDFVYVSDIVNGMILAAENISDGTPINLGSGRRYKLKEVANTIFDLMDFHPKVVFDASKPTGVVSRALDNTQAKELLGWEPKVSLEEGLRRTVEWYVKTHVRRGFVDEKLLMERA
jgi:UDP-glucose 4-epimerase